MYRAFRYLAGLAICLGVIVAMVGGASAHRPGEGYIYLDIGEDQISGRFEVLATDLLAVVGAEEVPTGFEAAYPAIAERLSKSLSIEINGDVYPVRVGTPENTFEEPGDYIRAPFEIEYRGAIPDQITLIHDSVFTEARPGQPVLVLLASNVKSGITENEARHALVFGDGAERKDLSLLPTGMGEMFANFFRFGMNHFLIGYDHIAFLGALLLPAVLVAQAGTWAPVPGFRAAFVNVATVVTLFTIAHSVTLSLAAFGVLRLPERPVEAMIALSIVIVAAKNFIAWETRLVWLIILGLGLLHGLGFAGVLSPYGLEQATMVPTLLAFNLGVEVGQLIVIVAVFPVLYLLRRWSGYRFAVLYPGSAALIAIGMFWFVRRAFDLDLSLTKTLSGMV